MREQSPLKRSLAALRAAGCPYRIRLGTSGNRAFGFTNSVRVYTTADQASRSKTVRGCDSTNEQHMDALTRHLLAAGRDLDAGGFGLDWQSLDAVALRDDGQLAINQQTWGDVRRIVKGLIAPGGPKCKDRNQLTCFTDAGYFGRMFSDDALADPEELRLFVLHETQSLVAHKADSRSPLIPLEGNARGFIGKVQMVGVLAKYGVQIATPELIELLKNKRHSAGSRKTPKPRFIPTDADLQEWLDQLIAIDPLRGWCAAMLATYGLRPHELWHIESLPGEDDAYPEWIEVASFADAEGGQTKTGARSAMPCPAKWIERYGLNKPSSREQLEALRQKHQLRHATDGRGQAIVINNAALGRKVAHWFKNKGHECNEFSVALHGWHQPPKLPGQRTMPEPIKGLCVAYSLRHAWALRAKATQSWSVELKASSMGHSEAVHARSYLVAEKMTERKAWMRRQQQEQAIEPVVAEPEPQAPVIDAKAWEEFQAFQRFKAFQAQQMAA